VDPILELLKQALGDERGSWVAATYRLAATACEMSGQAPTDELAERRAARQDDDTLPAA
jgi:hypothetical protein